MRLFNNSRTFTEEEWGFILQIEYSIFFANMIANEEALEAAAVLRESPLCRHEVKHDLRRLRECVNAYDRRIGISFGEKIDALDTCADLFKRRIAKRIVSLRLHVRKAYEWNHIENADLLARLEVARLLSDYADFIFEVRRKELMDAGIVRINWARIDNVLHLRDVHKAMERLCDRLNPTLAKDLDLNRYKLVDRMVKYITNELRDGKAIERALARGMR